MDSTPHPDQKLRKSRRRVIFIVAAGLVLLGALVFFLVPREPSYKGKPLSYWLDEMNRAGTIQNTAASAEAIRAIGTNALPILLRDLKYKPENWIRQLCGIVNKNPFFKIHISVIDAVHGPAAYAVELLGNNAAPLIPHLEQMLNEDLIRSHAMAALLAIGSNSVPVLINGCSHSNYTVRANSALFLAKINNKDCSLHKQWAKGKQNQIILIIGWRYGTNEIAAIASNLNHHNSHIRRASADWLGYTKARGKDVIDRLTELLADTDELVRNAATEALKRIDPEAAAKAEIK